MAEHGALGDGIMVELEEIRAAKTAAPESEQHLTFGRGGDRHLHQSGFTLADIANRPHLPSLEWFAHSGDVDSPGGIQRGRSPGGIGVGGEQLPQRCE